MIMAIDESRTRVVLLGSGGGPAIQDNPDRLGPATLVLVDGHGYLFDAGEGAPRQILRSDCALTAVDHVFVTHLHFDHTAELGNFLAYSWFAGRTEPIDIYGPPGTLNLLEHFIESNQVDIAVRMDDEGASLSLAAIGRAHEVDLEALFDPRGGVVHQDERVTVRACPVKHGNLAALGYRIETPDMTIVLSGDRGGPDGFARFSAGADVMIHEVIAFEVIRPRFVEAGASDETLHHLEHNHSSPEQVGKCASEAGVHTLVLHHFVPSDRAEVSDDEWLRLIAPHFKGRIVVGEDLLEI